MFKKRVACETLHKFPEPLSVRVIERHEEVDVVKSKKHFIAAVEIYPRIFGYSNSKARTDSRDEQSKM